ncbi:hypothetical protein CANCADRAFT_27837 [Tortispora caseinolytica NRRL Y-17796]|uniref:Pan3 C-terminal knob domain-containing protein n=1 Tax=Tortispora caseinolytica NRRL Y-17796 TaxID=767744 RepID=A0A1E4TD57_9ASCO|nr:hypothetical protein CANCADRAFT_27837 [Tortispora caseinolytica NRRL Y-17796]
MYYQPSAQASTEPLQYHLYVPRPPYKRRLPPHIREPADFFLETDLHLNLLQKAEAMVQTVHDYSVPDTVSSYHSLHFLGVDEAMGSVLGQHVSQYRATSSDNGMSYLLLRLSGLILGPTQSLKLFQKFTRISAPGVINGYEAFTTQAFGDHSVVFVYDFYPVGQSFWMLPQLSISYMLNAKDESDLWLYICQVLAILRAVHKQKLAARVVSGSMILVDFQKRLRLNGLGIPDVLDPLSADSVQKAQADDFRALADLVFALVLKGLPRSDDDRNAALDSMKAVFSSELIKVVMALRGADEEPKLDDIVRLCGTRFIDVLEYQMNCTDAMERGLMTEVENDRLVRLLCKLNYLIQRPEFANDDNWSAQGTNYLIVLFHDYVFQQVDETGKPVIDLGHVLRCLNKLDVGVDESIMLVSRDERSCVIVTYAKIKELVDNAFNQLVRESAKVPLH